MEAYSHPVASRHTVPVGLWTRSRVDLGTDPRTLALASRLGTMPGAIAIATGARVLLAGWCATTPEARDGDLSGIDPRALATVCHWPARAGDFLRDLTDAGIVVDGRLADWAQTFGPMPASARSTSVPTLPTRPPAPISRPVIVGEDPIERRRRVDRERQRRHRARHASVTYQPRPRHAVIAGETPEERQRRLWRDRSRAYRARRAFVTSRDVTVTSPDVTLASPIVTPRHGDVPDQNVTSRHAPYREKENTHTRVHANGNGATPTVSDHPAVTATLATFAGITIDAEARRLIADAVGTEADALARWARTCRAWRDRGHFAGNARGIAALVDRFHNDARRGRPAPIIARHSPGTPPPTFTPPTVRTPEEIAAADASYRAHIAAHPLRLRPPRGGDAVRVGDALQALGIHRRDGR